THFSECHGSIAAYGVFSHRHGAEIEQELGVPVTFVPHLVPLDRGIFETIYARLRPGVDAAAVAAALERAYSGSPFVRLTGGELPELKHVVHTNFCDIGWKADGAGGQLVMAVCIDNLVKGAAGQAIQNFNVAFGFDETTALN
ncbi:MAG: N-acetyl-gamma-glutamyl-phosphate reductase, partial [Candidatus Rokuibacteriota bacterium]